MAKIHFYVSEPTKFARKMICITVNDDGSYVVETEAGCTESGVFYPSNEEMARADMLAEMQTGKPFSLVEDYC